MRIALGRRISQLYGRLSPRKWPRFVYDVIAKRREGRGRSAAGPPRRGARSRTP
jgi:hypothetical protein